MFLQMEQEPKQTMARYAPGAWSTRGPEQINQYWGKNLDSVTFISKYDNDIKTPFCST